MFADGCDDGKKKRKKDRPLENGVAGGTKQHVHSGVDSVKAESSEIEANGKLASVKKEKKKKKKKISEGKVVNGHKVKSKKVKADTELNGTCLPEEHSLSGDSSTGAVAKKRKRKVEEVQNVASKVDGGTSDLDSPSKKKTKTSDENLDRKTVIHKDTVPPEAFENFQISPWTADKLRCTYFSFSELTPSFDELVT